MLDLRSNEHRRTPGREIESALLDIVSREKFCLPHFLLSSLSLEPVSREGYLAETESASDMSGAK
jgi:hypothetical protein